MDSKKELQSFFQESITPLREKWGDDFSIFVFCGAGLSKSSGLKTFRESGGLWEEYDVQEVCSIDGYNRNPALVQEFYNKRREQLKSVRPNSGHFALAELEKLFPKNFTLATQNVDDLHERAGSVNTYHLHGELRYAREVFGEKRRKQIGDIKKEEYNFWRPDIVWFGESVKYFNEVLELLEKSHLFISVGTSAEVYPAAGLIDHAIGMGIKTLNFNVEKSSKNFDKEVEGPSELTLPKFINIF
ncbi:NAD-dependent protein deacylase [Bacteriovoracaceae bacterium]|nr:NAD-dependent protein deacylase [Bacteriovoracaceae bacterium]